MSVADIAILLGVAMALAAAIRHLRTSGDPCAGCGKAGSCSAHKTGAGECPVSASALADVEKRLADKH